MPDIHDARRLRAEGVPVTTFDGRTVKLVFDVDAIVRIEEDFGSLGAMQDALEDVAANRHAAPFFKPLLAIMRAGLSHDPTAADARFDPSLVGDYYAAVMRAIELAFPKDEQATGADQTIPTRDTNGSRGPTSTTSSPSDSDEATARSGA